MRISDWSSDVCSSDLLAFSGDRKTPFQRIHVGVLNLLFGMADTVLCSRTGTGSGYRSSFRPSTTATKSLGSSKPYKLLNYQTRVISIVDVRSAAHTPEL